MTVESRQDHGGGKPNEMGELGVCFMTVKLCHQVVTLSLQLSSTDRTEHMPLSCVCEKPINTVGVGEEESRGKLGNNKSGRLIPEHPGDI